MLTLKIFYFSYISVYATFSFHQHPSVLNGLIIQFMYTPGSIHVVGMHFIPKVMGYKKYNFCLCQFIYLNLSQILCWMDIFGITKS